MLTGFMQLCPDRQSLAHACASQQCAKRILLRELYRAPSAERDHITFIQQFDDYIYYDRVSIYNYELGLNFYKRLLFFTIYSQYLAFDKDSSARVEMSSNNLFLAITCLGSLFGCQAGGKQFATANSYFLKMVMLTGTTPFQILYIGCVQGIRV